MLIIVAARKCGRMEIEPSLQNYCLSRSSGIRVLDAVSVMRFALCASERLMQNESRTISVVLMCNSPIRVRSIPRTGKLVGGAHIIAEFNGMQSRAKHYSTLKITSPCYISITGIDSAD